MNSDDGVRQKTGSTHGMSEWIEIGLWLAALVFATGIGYAFGYLRGKWVGYKMWAESEG